MPRTKAKPNKEQGRGRGRGSGKVPPVVKKGKKAIQKPSIVPAKQIKVKKVVKAKTTGNPRNARKTQIEQVASVSVLWCSLMVDVIYRN